VDRKAMEKELREDLEAAKKDAIRFGDMYTDIFVKLDAAMHDIRVGTAHEDRLAKMVRETSQERDRLRNMAIRLRGCTGTCAMVSDCSAFIAAALAPQEEGK
jgi:hypothetical protein